MVINSFFLKKLYSHSCTLHSHRNFKKIYTFTIKIIHQTIQRPCGQNSCQIPYQVGRKSLSKNYLQLSQIKCKLKTTHLSDRWLSPSVSLLKNKESNLNSCIHLKKKPAHTTNFSLEIQAILGTVLLAVMHIQSNLTACLHFQHFVRYFSTKLSFLLQIHYSGKY